MSHHHFGVDKSVTNRAEQDRGTRAMCPSQQQPQGHARLTGQIFNRLPALTCARLLHYVLLLLVLLYNLGNAKGLLRRREAIISQPKQIVISFGRPPFVWCMFTLYSRGFYSSSG